MNASHPAQGGDSFWRLLYRYLWPFQYFRDVTRGSKFERQQNYRYNRAMRVHLPGFAAKWAVLTGLWFGAGVYFDVSLALVFPAAGCFLTGTGTLVVVVLMVVSWIWLERFPELY